MASLGDLMIRVGATIDGFSDAMKSVVSQASDAADAVADKLESIGNVGQRLAVLGGILTTAISLPLEEIARRSLDVAGTFEQTRIAFQSLMGSSSAATAMLSDLYKFAQNTPFEIPQVLDGARKLMALGFAAKDVVPILRVVGDQAAAMGQGGVGMDRILMNLGKIEAQGKITGHELRNLGEDDVPALASIARALGKSKEETQKLVSEGKVDAETAINAILQGMQLRTGGLMESQMSSFQAQLSNLKDQITLTAVAIGNTLLPVGKVLVNWAQEAMAAVKELAQWFAQLPAPIQGGAIALAALAAALGPTLVAIGGLGMALPAISAGLTAIAGIFGISVAALAPWTLAIAAALVALTALGVWVYGNWAGIRASVVQIFDGLGEIWNATVGGAVQSVISVVSGPLTLAWTTFKTVFMSIWDTIGSYVRAIWIGIKTEVIDPMMSALEKIPGFQKVLSAGSTFDKANHESSERGEMADIGKQLRVGADNKPFALTDAYQSALDKHNAKLKEAVELLAKFKKGYEDGIVSEKDFKQAQANVEFIRNDVPKREPKSVDGGKTKLDRNALDGLSGEHAHEEAQLALQRAQIEHDFQMGKAGSADTAGISPENVAQQEIAAAEKRKQSLDKLAADELKNTLANIDQKLKLYKDDQAGHQKLIEAKTAAEDKFKSAVQKTTFDVESVKKSANEKILQDDIAHFDKDLAAMFEANTRMQEAQKKHARDLATIAEETRKAQQQHAEAIISAEDKLAQFRLETGEITKSAYLKIKQDEVDRLYAMELQELADAQKALDAEKAMALAAISPDRPDLIQGVNDEYRKRQVSLDGKKQQTTDRHDAKTQDTQIGLGKDQFQRMGNVFGPFQSNFATAITSMVEGTKTFKQAWSGMVTGMLGQWISSLAQMASRWITHKLMELALHVTTNQAKVASDAAAAGESNSISLGMHLKQIMMAARLAAAKAWSAVAGIPIVGPVLAPVAAAATFAGVMAFGAISAERGGVLPDHNTVGFLHPQEMVLPKPISVGLQNLIASGGLSNAGSIMNQAQGGSMSSTALQMMRNTAAAGDVSHTHNWGGITVHNSAKDPINEDKVFNLMQGAMRKRNLRMA